MKKHILAVSVAAAVGVMAGAANAAPSIKANGVGNVNIIPYFSTQGNNVTQIHITNTDSAHGKAVKVRFRGAEWSDDIYDFTVFLSPGDVFTGQAEVDSAGGSRFVTSDGSCTLPATLTPTFPSFRVSNSAVAGTREGYIEIINMADIPNLGASGTTWDLYRSIKHVNGVAPCKTSGSTAAALLDALVQDNWVTASTSAAQTPWMIAPTGTLTSWSRVIDISSVKAFGVPATAIAYSNLRKGYFQQSNTALTPSSSLTADQIFYDVSTVTGTMVATTGTPITQMYQFDMPDLSSPIDADAANNTAVEMRDTLASLLAKTAVMSEFSTLSTVGGATDVVLTQPIRRYFYVYRAGSTASTAVEGTDYSRKVGNGSTSTNYMVDGQDGTVYEPLTVANRIPLKDLAAGGWSQPIGASVGPWVPTGYAGPVLFYDREEQYAASSSNIVISPTPPSAAYTLSLKGEASVISVNLGTASATRALGARLTMNDITVQGGYSTGWLTFSTVSKGGGAVSEGSLPVIGFGALQVSGTQNYGITLPLRYFGATGTIYH